VLQSGINRLRAAKERNSFHGRPKVRKRCTPAPGRRTKITMSTPATPPPTPSTPESTTPPPSPPYNFYLALAVTILATVIFGVVMYIFRDTFKEAALVTTALSTLFGIFGTVVGAYFGIKSTNDTIDKSRDDVAKSNNDAKRALAALPPEEGKKVMGMIP
jgi:hypothetical protein